MKPITRSQARTLCTDAEWRVVESSWPKKSVTFSAAQIKEQITKLRRLRGKWRDVSTRQVRRTQEQQSARVTEENRRSRQKAQLFAEALERLAGQLQQAEVTGPPEPAERNPRKPTKKRRAEQHRSKRATVRKQLTRKTQQLTPASRRPAATTEEAAGAPASAAGARAAKLAPVPSAKPTTRKVATTAKKKAARRAVKPKVPQPTQAETRPTAKPASVTDTPRQRAARVAAKQSRIARSGATSRARGHVSARGKRSQARRDSRN